MKKPLKLDMKLSESFLNGFTDELLKKKRVRVHPLGVFFLRTRKKRIGGDIGGGTREYPAQRYVHFKSSVGIKRAINK